MAPLPAPISSRSPRGANPCKDHVRTTSPAKARHGRLRQTAAWRRDMLGINVVLPPSGAWGHVRASGARRKIGSSPDVVEAGRCQGSGMSTFITRLDAPGDGPRLAV